MSRLLDRIDRVFAPLTWLIAGALVVLMLAGSPGVAEGPPAKPAGAGEQGAELFRESCGSCHTLKAAGTSGVAGPNLDEAAPSAQQVTEIVTNGGGGMPAFGEQLSAQQIRQVADFVAQNAGK